MFLSMNEKYLSFCCLLGVVVELYCYHRIFFEDKITDQCVIFGLVADLI